MHSDWLSLSVLQVSKMESQQKAIHELKASLLDELNQNGKLSDPDCQKVLRIHQEEQDKLNQKLDKQRDKQEQVKKEIVRKN